MCYDVLAQPPGMAMCILCDSAMCLVPITDCWLGVCATTDEESDHTSYRIKGPASILTARLREVSHSLRVDRNDRIVGMRDRR